MNKEKLKTVGQIAWTGVKCLALFGAALMGYDPTASEEAEKQRKEEEARRKKEQEEHEKFLNSLTENERKLYDELQEVKQDNRNLRSSINNMAEENESLKHRVRDLEPDYGL